MLKRRDQELITAATEAIKRCYATTGRRSARRCARATDASMPAVNSIAYLGTWRWCGRAPGRDQRDRYRTIAPNRGAGKVQTANRGGVARAGAAASWIWDTDATRHDRHSVPARSILGRANRHTPP